MRFYTHKLRLAGTSAETDVCGRSLKAQMKYADKAGAKFVVVIGDNEINEGFAEMRNMRSGERTKVALNEDAISDVIINALVESIADTELFSK